MKTWIWIALGAWALPAWAQSLPAPDDLPPAASARQWMEQDPSVQAARSALAAAGHTANMLTVSPYEWTTRLTAQRRSFERGSSSKEWHAQLERPIRIGGKAALDRQLGDVELEIATAALGEAIHESARLLLELWIDGLATAQAEKLLGGQLAFAQANLSAVKRRKKAGDASALEVSVASADLSDVQRQAELAKSNLDKARARLRIRFAGAQLPERVMADPLPPAYPEAHWLQRVLDTADPLKVALGQLRRAELTASRTSADRLPDPTVGVFAASEGFRSEQIVGVSISIPLGGTYRKERMLRALQEAEVARASVERQRRQLETEVAETYRNAASNVSRWRLAEQAAAATAESARLTQRAYTLGEADLQSLLLARRQFLDASRAALEAKAEALRANYRLLVDAHWIWDLEHE